MLAAALRPEQIVDKHRNLRDASDTSSIGVPRLVSASADDDPYVPTVLEEGHHARSGGSRADQEVIPQ